MSLRDTTLLAASISEDATFAEAVEALSASRSPALAVLDDAERVVGIFAEGDLLRVVFPGYLSEVRHTAFLTDDTSTLDQFAQGVRDRPVREFARPVTALSAGDTQVHAAERLMHSGENALPVVDDGRFTGMLSVTALCHARLARVDRAASEGPQS